MKSKNFRIHARKAYEPPRVESSKMGLARYHI